MLRIELTVPIGRPRPALIWSRGFGALERGIRIAGVNVGAFPVPKPGAATGVHGAGFPVVGPNGVVEQMDDSESIDGVDKHDVVLVPDAEDIDVELLLTIGITEVIVSGNRIGTLVSPKRGSVGRGVALNTRS